MDRRPRLTHRFRDTDMVAVAVPYTETALREKLKAAGGALESGGTGLAGLFWCYSG